MASILILIVDFLYYVIFIIVLARFILSVANIGPYQLREWVIRLTEPLLSPIRRLVPPTSGIDLSPMILLIGIWILRVLLRQLLF